MNATTQDFSRYDRAAQEDRCAPRAPVNIPASLRPSGSSRFPVVVNDLSIAGFACRTVTGMKPGTLCWLTLPGLTSLQSEIVWNSGTQIGCSFANLMNEAVLDSVLARYRVPGPTA